MPPGQEIAQFDGRQQVELVPAAGVHAVRRALQDAVEIDADGVAGIVAVVAAIVVGIAEDDMGVRPAAIELEHVVGRAACGAERDGLAAATRRAEGHLRVARRIERLRLADQERLDGVHHLDIELGAVGVVIGRHLLEELPPRAGQGVPVPGDGEHPARALRAVNVGLPVVGPHRPEPRECVSRRVVADVGHVDHVALAADPQVEAARAPVVVRDLHRDVLRVHGHRADAGERPRALHRRPQDHRGAEGRPIHSRGRVRQQPRIAVLVEHEYL